MRETIRKVKALKTGQSGYFMTRWRWRRAEQMAVNRPFNRVCC
jgi:hypothetical protein